MATRSSPSVGTIRRHSAPIRTLDQAAVVPLTEKSGSATFFDYLPGDRDLSFIVIEEEEAAAQAQEARRADAGELRGRQGPKIRTRRRRKSCSCRGKQVAERLANATRVEQLAIGDGRSSTRRTSTLRCQPAVEFRGRIQEWIAEVKRMRERGDTVLFVAGTEGRAERTAELLTEYGLRGVLIDRTDELLNVAVHISVGQLSKGFRLPAAELQVIAEPDVFEEERTKVERKGDRHRSDCEDLSLGSARPQDRRSGRPRRPRHRPVRRAETDWRRRLHAGVHGAALFRRGQAVRAGRAARPGPEVQRHGETGARQAGRHVVGAHEDPRQEGHARHGRRAAQAVRRPQSGAGPRVQPRFALAARVR